MYPNQIDVRSCFRFRVQYSALTLLASYGLVFLPLFSGCKQPEKTTVVTANNQERPTTQRNPTTSLTITKANKEAQKAARAAIEAARQRDITRREAKTAAKACSDVHKIAISGDKSTTIEKARTASEAARKARVAASEAKRQAQVANAHANTATQEAQGNISQNGSKTGDVAAKNAAVEARNSADYARSSADEAQEQAALADKHAKRAATAAKLSRKISTITKSVAKTQDEAGEAARLTNEIAKSPEKAKRASEQALAAAKRGDANAARRAADTADAIAKRAKQEAEKTNRHAGSASSHSTFVSQETQPIHRDATRLGDSVLAKKVQGAANQAVESNEKAARSNKRAKQLAKETQVFANRARMAERAVAALVSVGRIQNDIRKKADNADSEASKAANAANQSKQHATQVQPALKKWDKNKAKAVTKLAVEAAKQAEMASSTANKLTDAANRDLATLKQQANRVKGFASQGLLDPGVAKNAQMAVASAEQDVKRAAKARTKAERKAAEAKGHAAKTKSLGGLLVDGPTSRPITSPAKRRGIKGDLKLKRSEIPVVPDMKKILTKPKGLDRPTTQPTTQPHLSRGRWRQVGGGNAPDFLPGGYSASIFIFRVDNVLEVHRSFGKNGELSHTYRISYKRNKSRTKIALGKDPKVRPSPAAMKGFRIPSMGILAEPAKMEFPVVLDCQHLKNGRFRLGGKTYEPVKSEE